MAIAHRNIDKLHIRAMYQYGTVESKERIFRHTWVELLRVKKTSAGRILRYYRGIKDINMWQDPSKTDWK